MIPAIALILLASSIRYILVESSRLDTMIYNLINITKGLSPYLLILVIYLIVFITEIFIASGSAKAFLLIPLIMPIATALGLPANLVCLAYIFGDGFSNYIYPITYAFRAMVGETGPTYSGYRLLPYTFGRFGIMLAIAVVLFVIVFLIIKPFFFNMMTKTFEFEKKTISAPKHNKPKQRYVAFVGKELKLVFRDFEISASYICVYLLTPILLFGTFSIIIPAICALVVALSFPLILNAISISSRLTLLLS